MRTIYMSLAAVSLVCSATQGLARAEETPPLHEPSRLSGGNGEEVSAPSASPRTDTDLAGGTWGLGARFGPLSFNNQQVGSTIITLRHWLSSPSLGAKATGVDLGLGLLLDTGDGGTDVGFSVLAGLPLALAVHRHARFELVPEMTIALLHLGQGLADTTLFHLDMGARAGFEVTFGFMGLPQLALDASVGLVLALNTGAGVTRFRLATTFNNSPWDIFRSSIAARYYF